MVAHLSPYHLGKAREVYNNFNIFNAISWNLLVGIIITLFVMRLGASSTYIGLLSASFYIALFLLPFGKILAKRFSIIGIFSFTWIVRSICMVLAVAAPFVDYAGYRSTALLLVMLGVFLFHLFRGVGMIGNNPVLSQLAFGPDRGSYLTQIQIINSAIGMFGSFIIAMILGMEPHIFIFSILLILGVISGVISGYVIRKMPEPPSSEKANGEKDAPLVDIFKEAFSHAGLRHFMIILFLVVFVSGVTRTFVVVYSREVFLHNDGLISLYSVFGGLGYLLAGMSVKFLVDRIGAKPLFIVSIIVSTVCLIPVIFLPMSFIYNISASILFMSFLFFMLNFGYLSSEGIAQTYFLALIPPEKMLNLGILYFFIFGAAGAGGTFLSGLLLDFLSFIGLSPYVSFKILFIIMILMALAALSMQKKMRSLGSLSLKDALEVIFSVRDLRAISLLSKLSKTSDFREETLLLGELHNTPSQLAINQLLERAGSPRLSTRMESIRALEKLDHISDNAEKALIDDMAQNQYTTAYISARILGKHCCKKAVPMLREHTASTDYMLAGEAMIALAKMKDTEFRPQIESIILNTQNPRLKIMGAEALGIYLCPESLFVLLELLRKAEAQMYLRDEVVLAIAEILGTQRKFYKVLVRYIADNSLVIALGMDEAESALEFCKTAASEKKKSAKNMAAGIFTHIEIFQTAVKEYMENKNGTEMSRWIMELPDDDRKNIIIEKAVLAEAVLDDELSEYNCLRLLIVHWAAHELRALASKIK